MSTLEIAQIPCLSDNYVVLIHAPTTGETAAIDAPDAAVIRAALEQRGWRLTHIFVTHHHADHTGGIPALKAHYGCKVIGPQSELERVPTIDQGVTEKSPLQFAGLNVRVIETPGHTLGHVTYYMPDANLAFCGDTLFALGCGRIFEGDPEMMWNSLRKIMELPDETAIYCGHEYTLSNGRFALTIEPENEALELRMKEIEAARAANMPTIPSRLDREKSTNPFLRPDSRAIRARLGLRGHPDWQVFARLRELKNKA